jgi:acetyltransferase-like isoleucine patch superfamily enzyme
LELGNGVKRIIKRLADTIALALVFPLAAAERLARKILGRDVWFLTHGEALSLLPGKIGYFIRNAYYRLTLRRCSMRCQLSFGTYFTHSETELGDDVYLGSRCLVGIATIGAHVLLADHVQVLSGGRQHMPFDSARPPDGQELRFKRVRIGSNSWIGAGAVLMADVGEHCIIGAGSVVTKPIPDFSVAVGNPARVIRSNSAAKNL